MFLIHYYDREIRTNISNANTDTIVQVTDQGSTVRKINKNEVVKSLTSLKKQEYEEMKDLISDYRRSQLKPRQVVGDDTAKGSYGGDGQFVRAEVHT
jgi:endo-1,4-beta-mannosidase